MLNMEKLYSPYSKHYSLKDTLEWIHREGGKLGVPRLVVDNAITEVFMEMANGLKFSLKHPHHTVEHANLHLYLLARVRELHKKIHGATQKIIQSRMDALVDAQLRVISKTNKEYIKMNRPPISERSPVLRGIRRLWTGLRS